MDPETIYLNMRNSFTGSFITNNFKIATDPALLSVDDFELKEVKVYPNPVKDILFIEDGNSSVLKVEIYNMQGQLITSKAKVDSNNLEINFQNYNDGIYLVKLISNEGINYKRIIK